MRKLSICLGIILLLSVQLINAQDVFKQHGFDKEPLTLSNGSYNEFFSNDKIVQIGTVLCNTQTNKVVAFVDEDTAKSVYLAELSSRWLSVDPLARKYPQISPYVYVANNPIISIDPDGRDIYIVNKDGSVAGKLTLSRTAVGKEIWNKYANSTTHDVYITSQEWSVNTGNAAGTITHAEKNLVKDNKINMGTNADFNSLQGLDVSKSEGRQISLISVNKTYSDKNSKYGNAKTLFHEIAAHVDNPDATEQKGHEAVGITGYESVKDKPGYYKENVKEGSTQDTFNKELKQVIIEDKSKVLENEKK